MRWKRPLKAHLLIPALFLSFFAFQQAVADEKCDGWIDEILADSTDLLNDQMTYEVSARDECWTASDELFLRQYLEVMKPEMFAESRLAFSVWRACMDQHIEDAQACTAVGATAPCPPSGECDAAYQRYQCVFSTAKSYEVEWNRLQAKGADEMVDELTSKKCVGDESELWDAINEMLESLDQLHQDDEDNLRGEE